MLNVAAVGWVALTAVATVAAHTLMTNFYVDSINQGDGACVRMSMNVENSTFPVQSITSDDMACGAYGETAVGLVCPVSCKSTLTFEFREWPDASRPGAIDPVHRGPCSVYMKKVDSLLVNNTAAGPGWFKIFYDGYDVAAGKWCTEKLIANDGHLSVKIPNDLESGSYLVRPELLALHNAWENPPDPQFYVGCAQIFLQSNGTAIPNDTVAIPDDYVNYTMASMTFNIWDEPMHLPYPEFGPPAYTAGGCASQAEKPTSPTQTEGFKPSNAVLQNANWFGIELPDYENETACWDVSAECWKQSAACYSSAPPTGSKNCPLWDSKCNKLVSSCHGGNFVGPPEKGKVLTPKPTDLGYGVGGVVIKRSIGDRFRRGRHGHFLV